MNKNLDNYIPPNVVYTPNGSKVTILLVKEASGENYSIECGMDGLKNFDHHEKYKNLSSPCKRQIPLLNEDAIIEISHIDCNVYLTICRMALQK